MSDTVLHTIRLRGPWSLVAPAAESAAFAARLQHHAASRAVGSPPPGDEQFPLPEDDERRQVKLPDDWSRVLNVTSAAASVIRSFGVPTGIEPTQQVWLVIDALAPGCQLSLNEQVLPVAGSGHQQWDVSAILQPRNRLVVHHPAIGEPLFAEVTLEIREPASV